jgi:hypothetical protein
MASYGDDGQHVRKKWKENHALCKAPATAR